MIVKQRMVKRANGQMDGWMTVGGAECKFQKCGCGWLHDTSVSALDCAKKGVGARRSSQAVEFQSLLRRLSEIRTKLYPSSNLARCDLCCAARELQTLSCTQRDEPPRSSLSTRRSFKAIVAPPQFKEGKHPAFMLYQ